MSAWIEKWRSAPRRTALAALVLGAVLLAGVVGLVYAGIPGTNGVITGCYKKSNGRLRVIDAEDGAKCKKGERRLRWNRTGPPGPRGLQGAPGRTGYMVVDGGGCNAIQAAINKGGEVFVAAGTYRCRNSIVIDRDHVTLRGAGEATILRLEPSVNRPVLIVGQPAPRVPVTTRAHIRIANLLIDGNRTQQPFECHLSDACAGDDFLRNNGILLRGVQDVLVEHVTVKSARSGGLVSEHGTRRLTVRDFTSYDNHFDGLGGYRTEDSLFSGLHLHDNGAAGLSFDLDFVGNTVSRSVIADSRDVGLFMRDARSNVFSAVHIRDSGSFGAFVAENPDPDGGPTSCNMFTGIEVVRSGRNPAKSGHGMAFRDPSSLHNLVIGAQFLGNRDGTISDPLGIVETTPIVSC